MNLTSGTFTAPRDGIYSFAFTGFANLPASSSRVFLRVQMYWNGNGVGVGYADETGSTTANQYETFSFQSTFNLQKGDDIWLAIDADMSTGAHLFGGGYTHFSGYLLEEKIVLA